MPDNYLDLNTVPERTQSGGEKAVVVLPNGEIAFIPWDVVSTQLNAHIDAIRGLVSGKLAYKTKAELDAVTPTADANGSYPLGVVWQDGQNNGEYGWGGAGWELNSYGYNQAIEQKLAEVRQAGITDRSGYQYAVIDAAGKILLALDQDNRLINGPLNSEISTLFQQVASAQGAASSAQQSADSAGDVATASKNQLTELLTDTYDRSGNLFAIIDSSGRELLRIDRDGKLSAAGKSFVEATASGQLKLQSGSLIFDDLTVSDRSGYIVAFTDNENRVLFGIGADGRVSISGAPDVAAMISKIIADIKTLDETVGSPEKYRDAITGNIQYTSAGPGITCWGDSMTAGATGGGTTISTVLRDLSGLDVHNSGVGGESSNTIVARSGAIPFPVRIADEETVKEIPASGPVKIQFDTFLGNAFAPLRQGNGGAGLPEGAAPPPGVRSGFAGTLNGVPGYMYFTGTGTTPGDYYFQRNDNGAAVPMDRPPYPYRTDWSETQRDKIWIIWIGQNGNSNEDVLHQVQWMIDHMTSLRKKYLIIPRPTSNDTDDATFQKLWGRNVVCIRAYLCHPIYDTDGTTIINSYGLADAGITPTAQDITDIENQKVPTSLRNDAVHFNSHGYSILARLCYERLIELKYIL